PAAASTGGAAVSPAASAPSLCNRTVIRSPPLPRPWSLRSAPVPGGTGHRPPPARRSRRGTGPAAVPPAAVGGSYRLLRPDLDAGGAAAARHRVQDGVDLGAALLCDRAARPERAARGEVRRVRGVSGQAARSAPGGRVADLGEGCAERGAVGVPGVG